MAVSTDGGDDDQLGAAEASAARRRRTEEALDHLKRTKPYDGWSADEYLTQRGERLTMLRRRNVPLADRGFVQIALDARSGCVVGLDGSTLSGANVKGVVLVEKDGSVCRDGREIHVTLTSSAGPTGQSSSAAARAVNASLERHRAERERNRQAAVRSQDRRREATSAASVRREDDAMGTLTDEQNRQLLFYAAYAVLIAIAVKTLITAVFGLSILLIPLLLYASQTCPSDASFDAKREIKRVLRGVHLPEDHPDKPKTWLEQTVARVTASVTTEAATALGYEVTLTHVGVPGFACFAKFACARVPTAKVDCYWIGAFRKWWYVTMRKIEDREEG